MILIFKSFSAKKGSGMFKACRAQELRNEDRYAVVFKLSSVSGA